MAGGGGGGGGKLGIGSTIDSQAYMSLVQLTTTTNYYCNIDSQAPPLFGGHINIIMSGATPGTVCGSAVLFVTLFLALSALCV